MSDESAFNIKFVEVVEKYPCIYDYTRKDHSTRKVVEKAWKRIGSELQVPVAQCKEKWKNLRTALSRSIKSSGSGSSKKNYYLKDVMQFVVPFMKSKPQIGNFPSTEETRPELLNDDSNDSAEWELYEKDSKKHVLDPLLKQNTEARNNSAKKRNIAKRVTNDADDSFIDYVNFKKAKATVSQNSTPDLDFLKSLLPDLDKMNDYQKRQFKKRTLDIVDSILCDASPQNFLCVAVPASSPAMSNYSDQSYSTHHTSGSTFNHQIRSPVEFVDTKQTRKLS